MSNRAAAVLGGFVTLIFWTFIGWGEIAGTVHAFRQHGIGDGAAALFVPPWAWYRGAEFFWHKNAPANVTAQEFDYPPLNAEEQSVVSKFISKAMHDPLDANDLAAYREVLLQYAKRTGRQSGREEFEQLTRWLKLSSEYHREIARCLLLSIDQQKPFVSTDLERLRDKVRETGLVREAKLDADFRNIDSAARGSTFTDEFGYQHDSITRDEVLSKLKEEDVVEGNLKKISVIIEESITK
jgi:hypothetical protein